jgi:hypothetical protein
VAGCAPFAVSLGAIAGLAGQHTGSWLLWISLLASGLGVGAAAGAYSTARQVGAVIGSAAVGVLLQAGLTGTNTTGEAWRGALIPAMRQSLLLPVAFTLLGLVVCRNPATSNLPADR